MNLGYKSVLEDRILALSRVGAADVLALKAKGLLMMR
jgi:hypothetical protein